MRLSMAALAAILVCLLNILSEWLVLAALFYAYMGILSELNLEDP